ncbi:MAG: hypothetical protein JWQ42_4040 [Edaphobacter sp.]|nr:hypothetical protein [Edaphobacter sp.]
MSIKKEVSLRVTSQTQSAELHAIAGSEIRAVVGIDLGDKRSSYCSLDTTGGDLGEGIVATTADGLGLVFGQGKNADRDRMRNTLAVGEPPIAGTGTRGDRG